MSAAVREPQHGVFGNLTVPGRSGLWGFTLLQSMAMVPLVVLVVLFMATGRWLVAVSVVFAAALVIVFMRVKVQNGRTVFGRVNVRLNQRRKEKANKHVYLAGVTGKGTPDGAARLPGLMARSELS